MSTAMNTALSLSDEEFELVLRTRLHRAFNALPPGTNIIMLVATTNYSKSTELKDANWNIGNSGSLQTKGEILNQCVAEHNRRHDFDNNNKLRLIESSATAMPVPADDEIPF